MRIKNPRRAHGKEHGGSLAFNRRRAKRPLSLRHSHHVTLKSDFAFGKRSLFRNKRLIQYILRKACRLFHVKTYNLAICGNHIHVLVKSESRRDIQNFFRVFAGHTAQKLLLNYPLTPSEEKLQVHQGKHPKNQRKFWTQLLYSRVVAWGRDYKNVVRYINQNMREIMGLNIYKPRSTQSNSS